MRKSSRTPAPADREFNASPWFWGTIIAFAVATLLLVVIAALKPAPRESAVDTIPLVSGAIAHADAAVAADIVTKVDELYAPVYAAIPLYLDHHYSVVGEYAELLQAAADMTLPRTMEADLFGGYDQRLAGVVDTLNKSFENAFASGLVREGAAGEAPDELFAEARRDALDRMKVTVPVAVTTNVGVTAAAKAAAKIFAEKVLAKVAVKSGGKAAAILAGVGTGAGLCWWAGPGAGLCAIAGGTIAWFGVDYAVIKVDEFLNRDDFESDLRASIDQQKADTRAFLEQAFSARSDALRTQVTEGAIEREFTLRELNHVDSARSCEIARQAMAVYAEASANLNARTPEALDDLRNLADENHADVVLVALGDQIRANLREATHITVSGIRIGPASPEVLRKGDIVIAELTLQGTKTEIEPTRVAKDGTLDADLSPAVAVPTDRPLRYSLKISRQRDGDEPETFARTGTTDLRELLARSEGLQARLTLEVTMSPDADASANEAGPLAQERETLQLTLDFDAVPFADLAQLPQCEQ